MPMPACAPPRHAGMHRFAVPCHHARHLPGSPCPAGKPSGHCPNHAAVLHPMPAWPRPQPMTSPATLPTAAAARLHAGPHGRGGHCGQEGGAAAGAIRLGQQQPAGAGAMNEWQPRAHGAADPARPHWKEPYCTMTNLQMPVLPSSAPKCLLLCLPARLVAGLCLPALAPCLASRRPCARAPSLNTPLSRFNRSKHLPCP